MAKAGRPNFSFRREGFLFDDLPLAVKPIQLGGDLGRLDRIVLEQEPHAQIGPADPAAGIDPRPEQKTQMPSLRRACKPRHVHQADMPRPLAAAQRNQSLCDEGAIEPDKRHHVGNRAERDVIEEGEQIRLRPVGLPKAALAQNAIDGDDRHESQPGSGEIAEPRKVVASVGIHNRQCRRQLLVGLMVIDDHDIESPRFRLGEWRDAGCAAIDANEQRRAALGQRAHGFDIRSIAFKQPVGNVDNRLDAAVP